MSKVPNNHIVNISNNLLKNIDNDGTRMVELTEHMGTNIKQTTDNVQLIKNKDAQADGRSRSNLLLGSSVWADSTRVPTEDDFRRPGWQWKNKTLNDKLNLYFFDGGQETLTVGNIYYVYFKGYINSWINNVQALPLLQVYTKPTGVNDAGAWYHSRITYDLINATPHIGIGEECYFFGVNKPSLNDRWYGNRDIKMPNISTVGEGLPSEEILTISLSTDSSCPPTLINLTIQELGYSIYSPTEERLINRKLELVGYESSDIIHHDQVLKGINLSSQAFTISDEVRIDLAHGQITFWVQSDGSVVGSKIHVRVEVSQDGSHWEQLLMNNNLIKSAVGTYTRFGNLVDLKPNYMRLYVLNADNALSDNFNAWISY